MVKNERSTNSRTVFHYRIQHPQTHHRQAQACNASAPKLEVKQMKVYDLTQEMVRQHHYIITYDSSLNLWYHDIDNEEAFFPYGTVYNESADHWESDYQGDGQYIAGTDKLTDRFTAGMQAMNRIAMSDTQYHLIDGMARRLNDPVDWLVYEMSKHLTQQQITQVIEELQDAVSE